MNAEAPIRVLVVEDHFLARLALTTLLGDQRDIKVVATATSGREAIALHASHRPDVTLMDLRLPELDGFAAIAEICRATPDARILVLSNYESEEDVHRALSAGAKGYLKKDATGEILVEAIRRVDQGQRYLPPSVAERLSERSEESPLTPRELQVLDLIFKGLANKEIGETLSLTPGTVRIYVSNILAKLGVERRTEAVSVALRRGLLRSD
jgi:DNA-binding NarL/FixJ family response regulator